MNLSEPASESCFVKVAPLPCFSICSIPGVHVVNPLYPVQTWNSDAVFQGGIFFQSIEFTM